MPAPPKICTAQISIVRLHGEACYHCGAAFGQLRPGGSVVTPVRGGTREWPVVVCHRHRGVTPR